MTEIFYDKNDAKRIVRAIEKAITDDVPQFIREHPMETLNCIKMIRSDFINENLKNLVVREGMDIVKFSRYSWRGCILVDRTNKITYTITTAQNLKSIPRKQRQRPHFLQTILGIQNAGYHGKYEQMTLFPMSQFDSDTLEDDYKKIVDGAIDPEEGYVHYIITYEYERSELREVNIEFMDKNFYVVDEASLNEFMKPDFAQLTETDLDTAEVAAPATESPRRLVSLKTNALVQLKEVEKQA